MEKSHIFTFLQAISRSDAKIVQIFDLSTIDCGNLIVLLVNKQK
ncbi:hypothetical protein [Parvimonas micra]